MGARGSKARSDRYMLRVVEFVRFASQGDLPSLQRMLKKRSVDVNAQDVRLHSSSTVATPNVNMNAAVRHDGAALGSVATLTIPTMSQYA